MARPHRLPLGHAEFICPLCRQPEVRVCCSIALGPDPGHDSNVLEAVSCTACNFLGAVTARTGVGRPAPEHRGCTLEPDAYRALIDVVDGCTTPEDPACGCPIHRELGRRYEERWPGLVVVGASSEFPFKLAEPQRSDVLIVDDDDDLRTTLAQLLEESGYQVARARGGQQALEYLRRHEPPRAVVLDLMMPGMSGLGVREELALDPRLREVKVFLFTAASDRQTEIAGLAAGQVLRKTSGLTELLSSLDQVMNRP